MHIEHRLLAVNGIDLSLYSAGPIDGRPVWLLHGFPECWYAWHPQIEAMAAAGYRVFAPEMRGYGQSSAPSDPAAYDLLTQCGDIQGAMDALGQTRVAVVGHDWGAPVAWHLALLEPARVQALGALSVPFGGRPKRPAIEMMREAYAGRFHYILYFQQPGVAEAELDVDIGRSLRLLLGGLEGALLQDKPADARLFDGLGDLPLPAWCSPELFAVYEKTFAGRGFHGALNWYRNFERNWQRSEPLAELQVQQPTLFLLGDRDPVGRFEAPTLGRMTAKVPRLEQHLLEGCGHWLQSEDGERVNALLLDFLARHYAAD
ncbi:alpha/beta hydrolase [Pseudomonas sp. SO81]|uniref:alpha/beta fold hydrolase n=1 Tax=Pseudomonas sp. SO81 TaxID=2983246 RepID=UPI0025A45F26|nr:alpha/beta hydrolase [Pseudomonas sp. SO81]WJN60204.1 Epoxide hydrolase [Pseudomonas sp. SO81]